MNGYSLFTSAYGWTYLALLFHDHFSFIYTSLDCYSLNFMLSVSKIKHLWAKTSSAALVEIGVVKTFC